MTYSRLPFFPTFTHIELDLVAVQPVLRIARQPLYLALYPHLAPLQSTFRLHAQ